MNFTVEEIPDYRIAYVRKTGPYGPANAEAMERMKDWAAAQGKLTGNAILFGIPQDHPSATPPEKCRYDAALVIAAGDATDESVCEGILRGGTYAVVRIGHTPEEVRQAWAEIFPALQDRGFEPEDRPVMERYRGELLRKHQCEICVPVKGAKE
ncbi:GyrI-like domain-containing protein [Paenibacillus sp. NFR01]|uniref:AraC family transcriptional regulator n=1 Tax=Paenibacillus sp. NFR01 TaxID=1566279 RepID=UPI0008C6B205|nr:GyrI-like domain-containing protein [Paenibacillus sp. NFR01]SET91092.1 DNA gyrase inhibitor GyrI [Paenibacillus sp. NFR01]